MKRYIPFLIVSLLTVLICGCSQWGGDTPLGITGGSEGGYGQGNDLNLPSPSDGGADNELAGSWRTDGEIYYSIWTFYANGNLTIVYYYQGGYEYSINGTYSTSGNSITLNIEGDPNTGTYSINGNTLLITINQQTMTLHRLQVN